MTDRELANLRARIAQQILYEMNDNQFKTLIDLIMNNNDLFTREELTSAITKIYCDAIEDAYEIFVLYEGCSHDELKQKLIDSSETITFTMGERGSLFKNPDGTPNERFSDKNLLAMRAAFGGNPNVKFYKY